MKVRPTDENISNAVSGGDGGLGRSVRGSGVADGPTFASVGVGKLPA